MTLDKLVRSFIWAIVLMFIVGAVTIVIALNDDKRVGDAWHDGSLLTIVTVVYWTLTCLIMAYLMGLQSHPTYLLIPTFPGIFFISVDPLPPQGLVYVLMLLYLMGVVYLTIQARENYVPDC